MKNERITKAIDINKAIEAATAALTAVCASAAATWPCCYHGGELGHAGCLEADAMDGDSNGLKAVRAAIEARGVFTQRASVDLDLAPQRIIVRWNDRATGAINSESGPGEWIEREIWASNDAPIAEVFAGLYPHGPHESVRICDECIYSSWWEYRLGWANAHRRDLTVVPTEVAQFVWASYAVGSNPLPHLRGMGFYAEGGPLGVTLARNGESPVTIKQE